MKARAFFNTIEDILLQSLKDELDLTLSLAVLMDVTLVHTQTWTMMCF